MENKQKHLEFIQGVISRMAGNLFFLKGWAITLIAGLFALSANESNRKYIIIAYFLVMTFWILDGYFLSQERLFRDLYEDVRQWPEKDINFSMKTEKYKKNPRNSWLCSMFSRTLLWFYGVLIIAMAVLMLVIK
jgi:hypothetical protein